jgi:hypothetical protein
MKAQDRRGTNLEAPARFDPFVNETSDCVELPKLISNFSFSPRAGLRDKLRLVSVTLTIVRQG